MKNTTNKIQDSNILDSHILLEDCWQNKSLLFSSPVSQVLCRRIEDLWECLEQLDNLQKQGYYLVGFISYEAGYVFQKLDPPNFMSNCNNFPLLHFLVFETCQESTVTKLTQPSEASILSLLNNLPVLDIDNKSYELHFEGIKQAIIAGLTYQVNYTAKYHFKFDGDPWDLYQQVKLRQPVAYAGFLQFNDYHILTHSPELFFKKEKDRLWVQPMKGTMSRDTCLDQDEKNKLFLQTDPKSRAENTMIVDLLRNDLSTVAIPGSVNVTSLLDVVSYPTLHQMISTIESKVNRDISFSQILSNLFPCGSVTGAPKRSTMQIIAQHEKSPRHVYTGAIGYITPENDMCFNVAIRTLLLRNRYGELGVGGGIVYDSTAQAEFLEMQLKARFFTQIS